MKMMTTAIEMTTSNDYTSPVAGNVRAWGVFPHHAGFGMFQASTDPSEWYESLSDLFEGVEYYGRDEFAENSIKDISGYIYDEAGRGDLYAYVDGDVISYVLVETFSETP